MTFLSPARLLLLVVVAGLAAAYVVLQRRRRHYALRFTNLDLLASVAPRRPGWRRHVPAALMALALAGFVVGLARPARDERVPKEAATVMLVVDTSISMEATDVEPNRLEAARAAGRSFVKGLPKRMEVGLVAFDRSARVLAPPTSDHAVVERAIDRLATGPGTAAGEAVFAALAAIGTVEGEGAGTAAIVLLSDGVTTFGRPVEDAAAAAAEQGVPVSTIAFGTDEGTVEVLGQTVAVPADPQAMSAVADATGGSFFEAFSAEELKSVYDDIGKRVGYEVEQREIGMAFVAVGALLLLVALAGSLLWTGRIL
jgi:Ca-activated chloride channel family protein